MSTYKVIQDIEAEDHILGPLSLRQFIYGLIGVFFYYLCFVCLKSGAGFLLVVFLPPALFCTFFAFPFGKDQPTEVWALAKIRFFFKPRKRIWNQSGIKELVTVTVPKKIEVQLTDGLSQTEVKSRLKALAETIDSRGWAIKNVAANAYVRPGLLAPGSSDDRLLSITSMPRPVPDYDTTDPSDVLDDQASPLAQQFGNLIQNSTNRHRQDILNNMAEQRAHVNQPKQWFKGATASAQQPVVTDPQAVTAADEQAIASARLKQDLAEQANGHLQRLSVQPAASQPVDPPISQPAVTVPTEPEPPVTPTPDPAILNLAKRNDLNVSTLAHEASRAKGLDDGQEVVISLH